MKKKEAQRASERQSRAVETVKAISTATLQAEAKALALRNKQRIAFDKSLTAVEIKSTKAKTDVKKEGRPSRVRECY